MKTSLLKPGDVQETWWHVDAADRVVGRLAVQLARRLMGKHMATYTPHVDMGTFIVVTNAAKVRLTGRKWQQKTYERYSGYPGGRTVEPAARLAARKPEEIIRAAVRRMLPKNKMAYKMLRRLKVYAGPEHPHAAQEPKPLEI